MLNVIIAAIILLVVILISSCFYINKSDKIPKKIFQTWKTNNLPNEISINCVNELKRNNQYFEYYFYTDSDINDFIEQHYPEYKLLFDSFPHNIQKIDFFRLLIIYHYGGFYFDIDVNINKNISKLCKYSCVFPEEYKNNTDDYLQNKGIDYLIGNYAFGAEPKHPFIKYCIDNVVNQKIHDSLIPQNKSKYIFYTTGPVFITDCYADFTNKRNIKILKTNESHCFGNYGKHLMQGSWIN